MGEPTSTTPAEWLRSRDTGISSTTICEVMADLHSPYQEHNPPADMAGFGRCYRLLNLFLEWKPRLGEVAEAFPAWASYVQQWPKLSELYVAALTKNSARCQDLNAGRRNIANRTAYSVF